MKKVLSSTIKSVKTSKASIKNASAGLLKKLENKSNNLRSSLSKSPKNNSLSEYDGKKDVSEEDKSEDIDFEENDVETLQEKKLVLCILGGPFGKTTLLTRYLFDEFSYDECPTCEESYFRKHKLNDIEYDLEYIDTSGDPTNEHLHERKANAFILLCDINTKGSLQIALEFNQNLTRTRGPLDRVPKLLVATAVDTKPSTERLTDDDLKAAATIMECDYTKVSALTGEGVTEGFNAILMEAKKYVESQVVLSLYDTKHSKLKLLLPRIPLHLDSRMQSYNSTCLVNSGQTINFYENIGTTLLVSFEGANPLKMEHSSPVVLYKIKPPYLVTIHKNGAIQLIHYERRYLIASNMLDESIAREVQALLIDDYYLVAIGNEKLIVFDIGGDLKPFKEIPLNDNTAMASRSMHIQNEFTCWISETRILIAGSWAAQVWEIDMKNATANLILQATNPSQHQSYIGVSFSNDYLLTRSTAQSLIWKLEKGVTPIEVVVEQGAIITCVYMEKTFFITGDSFGDICIRQLHDGKLIQRVNRPRSDTTAQSPSGNLAASLDARIKCLIRSGRYVWVGSQESFIAVYDLYIANQEKPLKKIILDNTTVKSVIMLDPLTSLFQIHKQPKESADGDDPSSNTACQFIEWKPKLRTKHSAPTTFN